MDLGEGRVRTRERTSNNPPLVVVGELAGLGGDPLEEVVHEGVHDGHGLRGDAGVGVHLLQHLRYGLENSYNQISPRSPCRCR